MKQIGNYLNSLGRLTAYYSFILSNFNYCPVTWRYCSENNSLKMEKIQERALRFIYDDMKKSSFENLLEKSKLPSLKIRRLKTIAVETFKIIHKSSPSYLHDLINIKLQNYNFRSRETAVLRIRTIRYGLKSFRYNAAQIWNELPNHCRRETSLGQFKKLIQTWDPMNSSCQCSACI